MSPGRSTHRVDKNNRLRRSTQTRRRPSEPDVPSAPIQVQLEVASASSLGPASEPAAPEQAPPAAPPALPYTSRIYREPQSNRSYLEDGIISIQETGEFSDLIFLCDGEEFKLHKSVVCPLSSALKEFVIQQERGLPEVEQLPDH